MKVAIALGNWQYNWSDDIWLYNESKRSILLLEAQNLSFLIFIASTFVIKTVSSTDKKTNKQARHRDDKTFTFIWIFSSPSTRLKTGTSASRPFHSSQVIENWSFEMKTLTFQKFILSPCTPPTPSRLLLPGCWPHLRPPAGLQDGKGWGDLHPSTL